MLKKSKIKLFTSETAKNASDSALSPEQINDPTNSNATANDAEYLKELAQVVKDRAAD